MYACNMRLKVLVVLGLFLTVACSFHTIYDNLSIIRSFLDYNKASSVVLFICQNNDVLTLSKSFFSKGITVSMVFPESKMSVTRLLKTEYNHIALIVDMSCEGSDLFMSEASKEKKFSILHHWLLLTSSKNSGMNEDPLIASLEHLDIPVDSHVTVARLQPNLDHVMIQDVYRLGEQPFLTGTSPLEWRPGQRWPSEPLRTNYGGMYIKTAVIVVEDPWEHFFDMRYKHLNTLSKNNYALMAYVSEMLNFRMNLTMADSWGFPVNGTKDYAGIVGIMQRGEVEIGAAGLLIKETRMDYVDYAGEIVTFRGAFMFLKPSLSEVSVIYTLPFSSTVWITFTLTVIFLTVGLEFSQRLLRKDNPSTSNPHNDWSEAVVNSVGIVCEQGIANPPENVSSRIAFLALLMLSVFVLTSYSAIIVSLLQTSSDAVNTLTELMDSGFKLSMRDIGFNTNYANDTTDPEIKRLYKDKLFPQPYKEAFITQEAGIQKIRSGLFAFHGDAGAYKVMSDTFEEYDKCRLKEIKMYSTDKLAFPVKKNSQFREHITQKARWLREIGLVGREYKRWFYQKPKCDSNSQGFVSVRLLDFYPVLLVLIFGICSAVLIFVGEVFYNFMKNEGYISRFYSKFSRNHLYSHR